MAENRLAEPSKHDGYTAAFQVGRMEASWKMWAMSRNTIYTLPSEPQPDRNRI